MQCTTTYFNLLMFILDLLQPGDWIRVQLDPEKKPRINSRFGPGPYKLQKDRPETEPLTDSRFRTRLATLMTPGPKDVYQLDQVEGLGI